MPTYPDERTLEVVRRLKTCAPSKLSDIHQGNRARLLRLLGGYNISGTSLDRWRKGGYPRGIYLPALEAALSELGY